MSPRKVYISSAPENLPEWYWVGGLHDAEIVSVEAVEMPFEHDEYSKKKRTYYRNAFILKIDAQNALYDNHVEEIRLYNYKILTPGISLENRKSTWWMADRLCKEKNHHIHYILEIDLQDLSTKPKDFTFKIAFDHAEVKRSAKIMTQHKYR